MSELIPVVFKRWKCNCPDCDVWHEKVAPIPDGSKGDK